MILLLSSLCLRKDDLLIDIGVRFRDDGIDELVESFGDSLQGRGRILGRLLHLVLNTFLWFITAEELWQIPILALSISPFIVSELEWCFFLFFSFRWWFIAFFWCFDNWFLNISKHLNSFLVNFLCLVSTLETNDSLNVSDILLDFEEFIHESKFQLVILFKEFVGVAHSLDDHILLIG